MIAEVIGPIAMWGTALLGVVALAWGLKRLIASGAVAEDDLGEVEQAREDEADARRIFRTRRDRMRDAARRGWLREPKD